jgi:hypothetical protein
MVKRILIKSAVALGAMAVVLGSSGAAQAAGGCYWTYSKAFGFYQFCSDPGCSATRPGQAC